MISTCTYFTKVYLERIEILMCICDSNQSDKARECYEERELWRQELSPGLASFEILVQQGTY